MSLGECTGIDGTQVCDVLYDTWMFFRTDKKGYGWQGVILSVFSAAICGGLYSWLRKRKAYMTAGNVDQANEMFLHIYGKVIRVYLLLVFVMLVVYLLFALCLAFQTVGIPLSFLGGILATIPSSQMIFILSLFSKNTISDRAFWRAFRYTSIYAALCYPGHVVAYICPNTTILAAAIHLTLDSAVIVFGVYLWCRQYGYFWSRKAIILRYLLVVSIIEAFQIVDDAYLALNLDASCVGMIGRYIWFIVYPFVFFWTVKADSDYWWFSASEPILSSTQETLAKMHVFTLPGFDPLNDRRTRFRKLKQIVSGYVPVIPFKKIEIYDPNSSMLRDKPERIWPHLQDKTNRNSPFYAKSQRSVSVSSIGSDTSGKSDQFEEYDEIEEIKSPESEKNTIGKGATSKVYRGRYRKQDVAIKCLLRLDKRNEMSWSDLTLIFRESILSSSLSHPNIVKFIGASLTYEGFYLVYEYCVYGDLQQIVVDNIHKDSIPELRHIKQRLLFLKDIAYGMAFLHQHGFIHRDLKTANVVVNYDYGKENTKKRRFVAKICDFGVTRKMQKAQFHQEEPSKENNRDTHMKSPSQNKLEGGSVQFPWSSSNSTGDVVRDREALERMTTRQRDPDWIQRRRDRRKAPDSSVSEQSGDKRLQPSAYQRQKEPEKTEEKSGLQAIPESEIPDVLITTTHDGDQLRVSNADIKEISRTIHVGTPAFLAPEILLKLVRKKSKLNLTNQFDHTDPKILSDFKTDVFSFGVCMWSLITAKLPYDGFEPKRMVHMIFNQQRLGVSNSIWDEWDEYVDKVELKKLLEACWAQYPMNRPSFDSISQRLNNLYDDMFSGEEEGENDEDEEDDDEEHSQTATNSDIDSNYQHEYNG